MSSFPSSYKERNRVCWKIPDCLPVGMQRVKKDFQLHNMLWQYMAFKSNELLVIEIYPISPCNISLFKLRGGIINHAKKEIISIKAINNNLKSKFILIGAAFDSCVDKCRKRNTVSYIFIEINQVNHLGTKRLDKLGGQKIENDFKNLLLSGTDSDLTIEVKNKKFQCHRAILRVRSPVFFAMLEHDMQEKASGVVKITDVEPTVFQEFLLYLYTGNSDNLNWENVTDLYKLGNKYTVEDLKSSCVKQMKKNISTENFNEFFLLSQQCSDLELTEITVQFFLNNSKEIVDNENWLTFLSNNLVEYNVLIKALAACK